MRTYVYIDGLILYNMRLKRDPQHKWLNLKTLSDQLFSPGSVVERFNCYCARIYGKFDQRAPNRQQDYLFASGTVPEISVHFSKFLPSQPWMQLVRPPLAKPDGYVWPPVLPELVRVQKLEEKGSDVNLASHLVRDAFKGCFNQALVISNDTDLCEPIRIVTQGVGLPVGIVAPRRAVRHGPPMPSPSLMKVGTFAIYIDDAPLAAAQFPNPIRLLNGRSLNKPAGWVSVPSV